MAEWRWPEFECFAHTLLDFHHQEDIQAQRVSLPKNRDKLNVHSLQKTNENIKNRIPCSYNVILYKKCSNVLIFSPHFLSLIY